MAMAFMLFYSHYKNYKRTVVRKKATNEFSCPLNNIFIKKLPD